MQALILAGGLGTRLRDVVRDRPKSMALVNGRPFLEHQIKFLQNCGIGDIVLSTGYMSEKIEEHFGSGKNHSISIRYVKEKEQLGTGGAIRNAVDVLDKRFFVLNGDSLFLVNYDLMLEFHKNNQADLTIALAKVGDKSRFGNVTIGDTSQITAFAEKENVSGSLINGGIYFFEKDRFDWGAYPKIFSVEKDFFPQVVNKNKVFGFASDSYFIDIGTAEDYHRFGEQLSSGKVKL